MVSAAFVRGGLDAGERVLYVGDDLAEARVTGLLRRGGVEAGPYMSRGQLIVESADDVYLPGGTFDPPRTLALLTSMIRQAAEAGYPGLRVTGEMSWARRGRPGSERLLEYEQECSGLFDGASALAICLYDRGRFDPEALEELERAHPVTVSGVRTSPAATMTPVAFGVLRTGSLRISGEIDRSNVHLLVDALALAVEEPGDLRLELRDLSFIDVSGLRALRTAARMLEHRGRGLILLTPLPAPARKAMALLGWDGRFRQLKDRSDRDG